MNKIFFILLLIMLPCSLIWAQDKGNVAIHSDPRLAILINKGKPADRAETDKLLIPTKKDVAKKTDTKIPTPRMEEVRREAIEFTAENNIPVKNSSKPTLDELKAMRRANMHGSTIGSGYHGAGYRVQIYNGPNRSEALRIKAEFMRNYPGIHTYFSFTSPHYRVKAGNFRRREDAVGLFRDANDTYKPCMIVPDVVGIN